MVSSGINVPPGKFGKINNRTPWNDRTPWKTMQSLYLVQNLNCKILEEVLAFSVSWGKEKTKSSKSLLEASFYVCILKSRNGGKTL